MGKFSFPFFGFILLTINNESLPSKPCNLRREENGPPLWAPQLTDGQSAQHHTVDDSSTLTDLGSDGTGFAVGNRGR